MYHHVRVGADRRAHRGNAEAHVLNELHEELALVPFGDRYRQQAHVEAAQLLHLGCRLPRDDAHGDLWKTEVSAADGHDLDVLARSKAPQRLRDQLKVRRRGRAPRPTYAHAPTAGDVS